MPTILHDCAGTQEADAADHSLQNARWIEAIASLGGEVIADFETQQREAGGAKRDQHVRSDARRFIRALAVPADQRTDRARDQ